MGTHRSRAVTRATETKAERAVRVAESRLVARVIEWSPIDSWVQIAGPIDSWVQIAGTDADLVLLDLKRLSMAVQEARRALAAERRAKKGAGK